MEEISNNNAEPVFIEGRGVYVPIIGKVIAMNDLDGKKKWDAADGVAASKHEWYAILFWLAQINALLKEHGGMPIEGRQWTSTESQYNATNAWYVYMNIGSVYTNNKTYSLRVRPVSAL